MTEPSYRIEVDTERMLVKLTLSGFWDRAMLDRYTREVEKLASEGAKAGRARHAYRVLIDLREHGVQSRDIAAEIEAGLIANASATQRHAVLISGSALHRAQVLRIGSAANARLFEDEPEARAWLLDDNGTAGR